MSMINYRRSSYTLPLHHHRNSTGLFTDYNNKFTPLLNTEKNSKRKRSVYSLPPESTQGVQDEALNVKAEKSEEEAKEESERKETNCEKILRALHTVYKKSRVKQLFPFFLILGYSVFGGLLFHSLESGADQKSRNEKARIIKNEKTNLFNKVIQARNDKLLDPSMRRPDIELRVNASVYWFTLSLFSLTDAGEWGTDYDIFGRARRENFKEYTDQLIHLCYEYTLDRSVNNNTNLHERFGRTLLVWQKLTHLSNRSETVWTFWNSMFLALTIFTTIGYGNIAPKTYAGRVAAIVYAIFGIPIFLMILHKLGRLFLALLQKLWHFIIWAMERRRCIKNTQKLKQKGTTIVVSKGGETYEVPVALAIGVTFAWIFACAGIFMRIEKNPGWDYFTSFYFVFISLTTIGFGDVIPSRSEDMFFTFGLTIVGLSLVSMCINVVQIKLEHIFEDILMMMMEEYQNSLDKNNEGPPDMGERVGMMHLWRVLNLKRKDQKRSSIFLPLIPENKRTVLMEKWKKTTQMRVKETQTERNDFLGVSTQTDLVEHHNTSPTSNYGNWQTALPLPLPLTHPPLSHTLVALCEKEEDGKLEEDLTSLQSTSTMDGMMVLASADIHEGNTPNMKGRAIQRPIPKLERHSQTPMPHFVGGHLLSAAQSVLPDHNFPTSRSNFAPVSRSAHLTTKANFNLEPDHFFVSRPYVDSGPKIQSGGSNLNSNPSYGRSDRRVSSASTSSASGGLTAQSKYHSSYATVPFGYKTVKVTKTAIQFPMDVEDPPSTAEEIQKILEDVKRDSDRGSPTMSSHSWPIDETNTMINSPNNTRTHSWTFIPSSARRASRGYQRGLVPAMRTGIIPAMGIKKQSKNVCKDEFKSIIQEIDNRIKECRELNGPTHPENI